MTEKKKSNEGVSSIYFIGIGGIGMSALARYFHSKGAKVSGYDKTPSSLTQELEQEGMDIHYEEQVDLIPKDAELIVYTPAVPKEHKELLYYQENGYKVVKRSDVLQIVTESSFNICIAGTHGKTTITTMVAHVLRHTGYGCNAFLGGISVNYGTNFWSSERNVSVVEADEYDRSFLKLSPDIAIITAMDPDHLDIYGTAEAMEQAFIDFSNRVRTGGLLISKFGLKRTKDLKGSRKLTYSVQHNSASAYAESIKMTNGSYEFDVVINNRRMEKVKLNIGGMHNVENAIAAITAVSSLHIDDDKIRAAIADFKGVKRRFEYIIKTSDLVFIDDYAHHPEELRALISGAKSLFSDKKSTMIFQPHLYSRTKDLADGFAEVLDMADEVILLPIYPARELPIAGVNSEMILDKMKNKNKKVLIKEELKDWVKNDFDRKGVLMTAGAGDIDLLVEPIKEILNSFL
ncbi:MAG TPA: UDP-N-acetylmuramate--L-alanine ligase [Chitinophagaceae bacterium]|nr:UDP-N-acetylmuramate--L-alanine ligase [Chitinophagaceae bacterium]